MQECDTSEQKVLWRFGLLAVDFVLRLCAPLDDELTKDEQMH